MPPGRAGTVSVRPGRGTQRIFVRRPCARMCARTRHTRSPRGTSSSWSSWSPPRRMAGARPWGEPRGKPHGRADTGRRPDQTTRNLAKRVSPNLNPVGPLPRVLDVATAARCAPADGVPVRVERDGLRLRRLAISVLRPRSPRPPPPRSRPPRPVAWLRARPRRAGAARLPPPAVAEPRATPRARSAARGRPRRRPARYASARISASCRSTSASTFSRFLKGTASGVAAARMISSSWALTRSGASAQRNP